MNILSNLVMMLEIAVDCTKRESLCLIMTHISPLVNAFQQLDFIFTGTRDVMVPNCKAKSSLTRQSKCWMHATSLLWMHTFFQIFILVKWVNLDVACLRSKSMSTSFLCCIPLSLDKSFLLCQKYDNASKGLSKGTSRRSLVVFQA